MINCQGSSINDAYIEDELQKTDFRMTLDPYIRNMSRFKNISTN